jgi:hypothetical protein
MSVPRLQELHHHSWADVELAQIHKFRPRLAGTTSGDRVMEVLHDE